MHPHIGEIRTFILVYEKGGVKKRLKAPARVKVELPDLWKKFNVWWCGIALFVNRYSQWYGDIPNCFNDTVWNINITKGKTFYKKVLFQIITHFLYHKGIRGSAETSFGLCSSSAKNPQKINLYGNFNTLAPKNMQGINGVASERYLSFASLTDPV